MRKRILALALVLALVFALCACGEETQTTQEQSSPVIEATSTPEPTPEPTPQPEPVIDYEITYTNCKVGTDDAGRNTFAQILFVVENKGDCNITLSYEKPSYVDLVDEAGNIVETKNIGGGYPSVIKPGEKSYFFQQEVITTEERNLTAVPSIDFQQAFEEITFLPTKDVTFGRDTRPYNPSGVVASGIVETRPENWYPIVTFMLFCSPAMIRSASYRLISPIRYMRTARRNLRQWTGAKCSALSTSMI